MAVRKPLVLVSGRPTELAAADTLPAGSVVGGLVLLGTYSVGETTLITASLGVRRYSVTIAGITTTDRIIATLNGVPGNGSLQDVYVSAANTLSVGVLVPALGIGAVIAVPIAVYRVVV